MYNIYIIYIKTKNQENKEAWKQAKKKNVWMGRVIDEKES